jgi:hypothetical protein
MTDGLEGNGSWARLRVIIGNTSVPLSETIDKHP